jgi:hypothetical protein
MEHRAVKEQLRENAPPAPVREVVHGGKARTPLSIIAAVAVLVWGVGALITGALLLLLWLG